MSHPTGAMPRQAFLGAIAFGIIVFCAFIYDTQRDAVLGILNNGLEPKSTIPIGPYYKVVRVVDGDTLLVNYNGTEEKVRLIGINTPETVDPRKTVECFGKEAGARMKELADGKSVRLEFDSTQDTRDIYGRLLAYVYLEDNQMLNRKMIAEGYAYEYTYMTPYKYQADFREVQTLARTSERGLWAPNTCAGKK